MSASSHSAQRQKENVSDSRSRTDWERVKREYDSNAPIAYDPEDGPYDPNDDAAVDAYWDEGSRLGLITVGPGKRGPQKAETKQLVSLRLSKEVLDHFKATGRGWQTRIDETLKRAVNK
jgi:BrnA antitoxin of type II toxin-antitoxin system